MIVDSSALVALFIENDEHHPAALKGFTDKTIPLFVIPDRILEETLNVLIYRLGIEFALNVLGKIKANQRFSILPLSEVEHAEVLQTMGALRKKISFEDYLLVYLSLKSRHPPFSFDQQLMAIYKANSKYSNPGK